MRTGEGCIGWEWRYSGYFNACWGTWCRWNAQNWLTCLWLIAVRTSFHGVFTAYIGSHFWIQLVGETVQTIWLHPGECSWFVHFWKIGLNVQFPSELEPSQFWTFHFFILFHCIHIFKCWGETMEIILRRLSTLGVGSFTAQELGGPSAIHSAWFSSSMTLKFRRE